MLDGSLLKLKLNLSSMPVQITCKPWRREIYSALRRVRRVIKWSTLIAVVSSLSLTGNRAEFGERSFSFSQLYKTERQTFESNNVAFIECYKLRIFRKYLKKNS